MKPSAPWLSLLPLCGALLVAGCNKQGPEAPLNTAATPAQAATTEQQPAPLEPPPPPPLPDASPNAVAVGSAVGANGAVTTQLASYAAGETVYASVPTAGHSPGDSVRIYWTNAKGLTDKEEEKEVAQGQAYVTFEFSQADGMQPGPYNAQVDINDTPVGIVDFTVQ